MKTAEMEVDARAMGELHEEEQNWQELKKQLIESHKRHWEDKNRKADHDPDFMKNYLKYLKEKAQKEVDVTNLNGQEDSSISQTPLKEEPSKGIVSWIKEHPVETVVIGAVIVAGVYLAYKYYKESQYEFSSYKSLRRKKRRSLLSNSLKAVVSKSEERQESLSETEEETTKEKEPKPEPEIISAKELVTGVAATVAGAALGKNSLLAALPFLITGIRNHSLQLTMAGAGMAIAAGYQNKEEPYAGSFLEEAFIRVKTYLKNFAGKLFPFKTEVKESLNGNYYKSMLGNIPLSQN